jgi:hypothetical protein
VAANLLPSISRLIVGRSPSLVWRITGDATAHWVHGFIFFWRKCVFS